MRLFKKNDMSRLTHTDDRGKANMVDIRHKPEQERIAIAEGFIYLQPTTLQLIRENSIQKGDVLSVARIAGIQAAKRASELIPLCHQILLNTVSVEFTIEEKGIKLVAIVKCTGTTGVEMEALTAVSVSLLTIYDMCKAVDKNMILSDVKLIKKEKY